MGSDGPISRQWPTAVGPAPYQSPGRPTYRRQGSQRGPPSPYLCGAARASDGAAGPVQAGVPEGTAQPSDPPRPRSVPLWPLPTSPAPPFPFLTSEPLCQSWASLPPSLCH